MAAFLRRLPGNNMEVYGALLARDGFDSLESMCLMDDEDVLAAMHFSPHPGCVLLRHAANFELLLG